MKILKKVLKKKLFPNLTHYISINQGSFKLFKEANMKTLEALLYLEAKWLIKWETKRNRSYQSQQAQPADSCH